MKQRWNLVRGPPQEASGAMDRPIEEQGERPKWGKILDIPLKTPGGTKDDNGNVLLLSDFLHYPLGIYGPRREEKALRWRRKKCRAGQERS